MVSKGQVAKALEEAVLWVDPKVKTLLKATQEEEEEEIFGEDLNSFDAAAIVKRGLDEIDPCYIYKINNGFMNNQSDYVFKTSKVLTKLACDMDIDGPKVVVKEENAYFDGTQKRVHGFISFAL